jgi:hypothetical protein
MSLSLTGWGRILSHRASGERHLADANPSNGMNQEIIQRKSKSFITKSSHRRLRGERISKLNPIQIVGRCISLEKPLVNMG